MEYGDRVLVPATLPWQRDFLEMRRFGSVPADLPSAFLFRLLELRIAQGTPSFFSLFRGNVPTSLINQLKTSMKRPIPDKENVTVLVKNIEEVLAGQYECRGLELLTALSQTAEIAVSLYNQRRNREESQNSAVDLAWTEEGTLFILYGSMTMDSFVSFPCGHFDVKYKYFQRAQAVARGCAVSHDQLGAISFVSDCCDKDVGASIVEILFPSQNKPQFSHNSCILCGRVPCVQICPTHLICMGCGLKSYFTDSYMKTPCCRQRLDTATIASLHEAAKCLYHLTSHFAKLKHQKRIEEGLMSREAAFAEKAQPISILAKHPKATNPHQGMAEMAAGNREKGREGGQKCSTCNRIYEDNDKEFQCPNACQCKDCSIEAVLPPNNPRCPFCQLTFSVEIRARMEAAKQRCHVCGITLPLSSFAEKFPCRVCLRCVKVVSTGASTRGECLECSGTSHEITHKEMSHLSNEFNAACCDLALSKLQARTLSCGHAVCSVHAATLRLCRKCRRTRA